MLRMRAREIAAAVGGALHGDDVLVTGSVETDSRLVAAGGVFVAMPGESTDGHRFVDAAVAAGAALVIAERPLEQAVPHIVVDSGVVALGALAADVIRRVREAGELTVIGVTGSNGKTTTKNMLQAILEQHGPTVSPIKSFNNEVGAPMTMLRIDESTRYLVLEMGASYEGDIARLTAMSHPDVGVVLKVGLAHAGEFGGVEATTRAKTEMVQDLGSHHVAVLNRDDERVAGMARSTRARIAWFGTSPGPADEPTTLWAGDVDSTLEGTIATVHRGDESWPLRLRILGEHHVMNALAALTVADALGLDLERAVGALGSLERAERWRMELLEPGGGITVINDAYNASPDSMAAAIRSLAHMTRGAQRRSIAVLGEMGELGALSTEEHDRIGRLAVRVRIDRLVVVGSAAKAIHDAAELESSFGQDTAWVETAEEAEALLRSSLEPGDVVLVKSSLSAGLKDLGDRIGGR
ncbi:UDP-N-acetylmuramoyl-tripeptide--D-alanyl-D-alanine ligase [Agrococcus sp. Marseille-Q4369]|uniref:UDP-N-acetylmuramoyl-tripeptide--D-alanyl-D- alanine ligase n=1 Tax=Agrococcus sp. Marseille-Q4369 TaxID=2810513 RepID=UPI001B8AF29D|nr:UDP-N-acetylmuramoyl-tripeptide--D-alanyl-D-alanine ligase [Agrococcus sp. Marseille-Q4369]QUW19455.1 UDP-N-acetylmuramoyl-tripeptide--D-alanyl-D-alanine ligase [Agrococcus sp. Marseille-Q4369]